MDMISVIVAIICCGVGVGGGWYVSARLGQNKVSSAKDVAKKIIEEAGKEAESLKREKLLEVKDEWYAKKKEFEAAGAGKGS